ncbi:CPBP family intramembrane glutamic endopeptidase [Lutispora sp.]|uniref:CPBP family intramembrane glutamic endopeptidase n=1 Tax=Lutispora sp. TaxID=2828727 RepID=UPI002B1FCE3E|nr:CPBP family intramembrane glutamic endopeptidase [Lutispora sp.]MEA4962651.1 CPBP family intramembrane glutamic endopeptidase [Lutispora sp.]
MGKIKIKDINLLLLILLPLTFIVSPYSHSFMVIVILVWINNNNLRLRDFLYLKKVSASIVLLSVLIGTLLALMNFFDHFYFRFTIETIGKSKMSLSLSNIWFLFTFCIFKPFIEELFFRGFLYNFYKKKGILIALIISSVLFSVLHFDLYRIIIIFIIGVFLVLLYEITECFWISVLVHGSINAIHTLLVVQPVARYMKVLLYWMQGDNVLLFRLKLLPVSIVLFILVILVMILIMSISKNNIFQEKKFKLVNKNEASH